MAALAIFGAECMMVLLGWRPTRPSFRGRPSRDRLARTTLWRGQEILQVLAKKLGDARAVQMIRIGVETWLGDRIRKVGKIGALTGGECSQSSIELGLARFRGASH
ncbi:hypothetical protein EET67_19960 [Pseudaminobacter arsenicus]|uniref:Uncharacterized protein n=1 Tax=Borborobacter arsenicus TaxID=1851146 RepID=A0A432V1G7_9HYPH|nr:hypothetical protein [Pseudaminobacter arsenicus]RUM96033.1 hypothetical protein EET67_19960 [Pseudaminobacter arsenicus]